MVDFRSLRRMGHFLAVAEEGHFGRAAARLGLSQPPLTAQIQALEAELGVRLLERGRRGTRPTREGEALIPILRRIAEDAKRAEALARELRDGRHAPMAMACVTSALFDFLPPFSQALRKMQPELALAVQEMDTTDALEALRRGDVDFALVRLDEPHAPFSVQLLGRDRLLAALPADHFLAKGDLPIRLARLANEPLVLLPRSISAAYFDRQVTACREAGFEPRAIREAGSAMAQLAFVASGFGVALVSSGIAGLRPPGVVFRELAGGVPSVGVSLAWNQERDTDTVKLAREAAWQAFGEG
ncbi:LysR family transcriptional regulator [Sabulicella rubraurantiaca]|uniref:LysR family transcriptional regulator n=1 Tax=Sabulicella rubraurantiaca TaxID=2811429 RepID=UPI001A976738|nr:LysR family transcriptional regulator [Sabulicella rubraurantiaca]